LIRADLRRKSEIAKINQQLAIKLFTSKPTYQLVNLEREYNSRRANVDRISRFIT
jgi:hypothetical protein